MFEESDVRRFKNKTEEPNEFGCIFWKGAINPNGYGKFKWNKKSYDSHRMSWMMKHNRFPEKGMVISHVCEDNYSRGDKTYKKCVNDEHLKETTQSVNMKQARLNGRAVVTSNNREACRRLGKELSGTTNPNARFSVEDIQNIIKLYASGYHTHRSIGKLYDAHHVQIGRIIRGETYKRRK